MRLVKLLWADVYRDGGSYEAEFSTDENKNYSIFLEASGMPVGGDLRHKWLFEINGSFQRRPERGIPVITGSIEEQQIISRLKSFLKENPQNNKSEPSNSENYHLRTLEKLLS